jgi:hypothetical protein
MRFLSFLSKLALVCNLVFLLSVALHFSNFLKDEAVVSTVVIIGYALAVFVFTPLVNILYLLFFLLRKNLFSIVPKWLVWVNFVFLLLQFVYILFILNGSINN